MQNWKKITANLIAILTICLLLLWGNTYLRQREQFKKGEAALATGDHIAAIAGYESAIHMYTPGSSMVRESADRLWNMGNAFEQAGDLQKALIAYRSLRSSFYAVRGLTKPGEDWISLCDAKITALTGRNPGEHVSR